MSAMLWRIIIAVISVVLLYALIPLVIRVLGFGVSSDVLMIIRICIAGIAIFYILKGPPFPA